MSTRTESAASAVARQTSMALTGNEATAWGARLSKVQLVGFLPIGPADEVSQTMGEFYANGDLKGRILELGAEDAIFSAVAAAAQAGIRGMMATASEGIRKALPCLGSASFARIPLLLAVPHRALGFPRSILPDWVDQLLLLPYGWILIHAENAQECLDLVPQAYKMAEDPEVHLSVALGYDGWEISHSNENVMVPAQEDIDAFLPPYRGPKFTDGGRTDWRSAVAQRLARSPQESEQQYPELRYKMHLAMARAKELFEQGAREYAQLFGRDWGGVVDDSQCQGAEVVVVTMGSQLGAARMAAEVAQQMGISAGVLKLRLFNPFPTEEVIRALKGAKAVIALDRNDFGFLYQNLRATLYEVDPKPKVLGRIVGLGGNALTVEEVVAMFEEGARAMKGADTIELGWLLKGTRDARGIHPNPY